MLDRLMKLTTIFQQMVVCLMWPEWSLLYIDLNEVIECIVLNEHLWKEVTVVVKVL